MQNLQLLEMEEINGEHPLQWSRSSSNGVKPSCRFRRDAEDGGMWAQDLVILVAQFLIRTPAATNLQVDPITTVANG